MVKAAAQGLPIVGFGDGGGMMDTREQGSGRWGQNEAYWDPRGGSDLSKVTIVRRALDVMIKYLI